ncbi:MAG TPA: PAS domain S-box protein [Deltaproteobacteria bacterium]|nr:PAS domain S-box protein [Deltaproteobacteria bacterium]HOM28173.1 PAS domain S-box protein [Deltaproteobacteria bacterium]HPP79313.1 PAS domain S-box protein [Deltaproteobacteria bacterium]
MKDSTDDVRRLEAELASLRSEVRRLEEQARRYLRIEAELIQSENFYRTLFENSGTATILIEEDTTVSMLNSDFANFTGYSRDEVLGKSWTHYVAEDDIPRLLEYHRLRRIDPRAAPRNYEFKIRNKDGGLLHIYMTISMVPGTKQSIASMVDITALKKLEREVLDIGERERLKIGYALHDDLGQHLIGIEFMTKVLTNRLAAVSPEDASYASEINALVKEAIAKTRMLARGLCPVDLTSLGLESALEELARSTSNIFSISCTFSCPRHVPIRDNTLSTHLYYIAKEAVHNAIEHGQASKVAIELLNSSGTVSLSVLDNGMGMTDPRQADGMGIKIMNHRARMIGATLTIESEPSGGTLVTCTFTQEGTEGNEDS